MKKQISIKKVAQEANVSNATVSLVLNGKDKDGRVGKVTAEKVRKIAKELNYEPNHLARGLRMGKSNTIGLIVADISNPFFATLAFHIQEYAEKFGYSVIITNSNESDEKFDKILQVLFRQQVDGLIIVPTENSIKSVEKLIERKIPLVLLDRWFPDLQTCHVVIENYQVSKKAVQYLVDNNCKKIALISYKTNLPHMTERGRGYEDVMKKEGLYNENLIKEVNYISIEEDIKKSMDDLFAYQGNDIIDGIFFTTNSISMIGIKYLLENKIKILEDVKIVCFDKSDAFDFAKFNIPYVLQPIPEMGRMAVEVLINQIVNGIITPSKIELFAKLIEE